MAGNMPLTKSGHDMYEMASLLQKAIRRSDFQKAGYAAYELFGTYHTFLWRRLIVTSAEDCFGIMTKEIIALKFADDEVNGTKKGYERDPLFVAKAITLLCQARKNRDAVYVACNFMTSAQMLDPSEIEHVDIAQCLLDEQGMPAWVYDVHTLKGKMMGKTQVEMGEAEQAALKPLQLGLFDFGDWRNHDDKRKEQGQLKKKEESMLEETYKHRVLDPTQIKDWHDKMLELNTQLAKANEEARKWESMYRVQATKTAMPTQPKAQEQDEPIDTETRIGGAWAN